MADTVAVVADSKAQAIKAEIVSAAGTLERVTGKYADLGKRCAEFINLRLAQIENPQERSKARAGAVAELEADIRAAGLAPNVSLWLKLHALVSLVPGAADLPKSAAAMLCPLVRIDAKSGAPAFTRGYESDLPKLVDTAVKQRLSRDTIADLVQTLRTSKANPEAIARAEKAAVTRKSDAAMDKWGELTLELPADVQFAMAISDEALAVRLLELAERIADAQTAIAAGHAVAA